MASVRSHIYILCVAILPPAWLIFWSLTRYDLRPPASAAAIGLLIYILALRKIVVPHFASPLRHIPSPAGDWFALGHGPGFFAKPKGSYFLEWIKSTPNDGMIYVRGFFHTRQTVILTSPDTIAEVLVKRSYEYEKPGFARDFLRTVVGNGLIVVEGREHKFQRKAVWPSFQGRHIKDLVPLFWRKAVEFVDVVGKELKNGPADGVWKAARTIELGELASRATLDIIGVAGFGREFGTLQNSGDKLAEHFAAITDPSNKAIAGNFIASFLLPKWLLRRLPGIANDIVFEGSERARARCIQLLAEKRAALKEKTVDQPDAIIEVLLRTSSIDDDSIVDQLLTFLAAGHETTASALQWASYMLAKDQKAQQRLRIEAQTAFATRGDQAIDADFIDSLEYLNAVCMETLRFWPTVPVTGRIATCNTTIGDQVIPKGTHVVVAPYVINRLPALWGPDAEDFVPDRWIRNDGNINGGAGSPYSFTTFLHGPRSCIGQSFAKLELKCLLAALVMRFQFEMANPHEKIIASGVITIKPENGLNLRMTDLQS